MANERFTVERTERTWTSKKEYLIKEGKKELLKLSDRYEAEEVCKLLNKVAGKKTSKRETAKRVKNVPKKDGE